MMAVSITAFENGRVHGKKNGKSYVGNFFDHKFNVYCPI